MIRLHCFGNPYYPGDELALALADKVKLPGFLFVKCYKPEHIELPNPPSAPVYILDVVKGIRHIQLVELSALKSGACLSAHDFDLGSWLLLAKRTGLIKQAVIIGLPHSMPAQAAGAALKTFLNDYLKEKTF
jgi:hypothetical protein